LLLAVTLARAAEDPFAQPPHKSIQAEPDSVRLQIQSCLHLARRQRLARLIPFESNPQIPCFQRLAAND
jgi:hypothetical protein